MSIIKDLLTKIIGGIVSILYKFFVNYQQVKIKKRLAKGDGEIGYPFNIVGAKNIYLYDHVSIGAGSTIYSTNAKLIIKRHVIIGPNLTIITGDHKYIVGRYIDTIKDEEKETYYDRDVIIEEDVWIGANVTILKGVTVGRSSIIAAGSLVIKDVPAFSIVGGVPSKVITSKWDKSNIDKHEFFLNEKR